MLESNCGNGIVEIGRKKKLWWPDCGSAIAEIGAEIFFFSNCGNGIAEKGGKKSFGIYGRVKKKRCHVHNIFTIFSQ